MYAGVETHTVTGAVRRGILGFTEAGFRAVYGGRIYWPFQGGGGDGEEDHREAHVAWFAGA